MISERTVIKTIGSILLNTVYLFRALAPPSVVAAYIRDCFKAKSRTNRYREILANYKLVTQGMEFSADWFSNHIPVWSFVFEKYDFQDREIIRALEIGSYEGRSSVFLLSALRNANITCVDAWDCSAYRLRGRDCDQTHMTVVEARFDNNLLSFSPRVRKEKTTSRQYFATHPYTEKFDFIYVDGPHYSDDVLVDAVSSFDLLKVGGILVFDDYLWRRYTRTLDNPAAAINSFLRLRRGSFKLVSVTSQLIIERTSDSIDVISDA